MFLKYETNKNFDIKVLEGYLDGYELISTPKRLLILTPKEIDIKGLVPIYEKVDIKSILKKYPEYFGKIKEHMQDEYKENLDYYFDEEVIGALENKNIYALGSVITTKAFKHHRVLKVEKDLNNALIIDDYDNRKEMISNINDILDYIKEEQQRLQDEIKRIMKYVLKDNNNVECTSLAYKVLDENQVKFESYINKLRSVKTYLKEGGI